MPLLQSFAALGRLIWRTPPPSTEELGTYADQVIPVVDRAEWLYQYWLEQSSLFSDSEKLGNVAAIHRWEAATMGRTLEGIRPPGVLADAHAGMIEALEMASRAAQLLSSGSRFHNASAVCEGQSLLLLSRERRLAALKSMRRYLMAVVAPMVPNEAAAQPETLAQAAALAAATAAEAQPPAETALATAEAGVITPPEVSDIGHHDDDDHTALPAFLAATDQEATVSDDGVRRVGTTRTTRDEPLPPTVPPSPPPAPDEGARAGWGSLFDPPDTPPRR